MWHWFSIDRLQQFCFREGMVGNVSYWKGYCHILIYLPFSPLMVVLLDGKYRRPPFISKGIEFLFSSISLAVSRALTLVFFLVLLFSTATLFHSLITGQLRAFSSLLPLRPRRLRGPQEWEWKRYHFMWRSGESPLSKKGLRRNPEREKATTHLLKKEGAGTGAKGLWEYSWPVKERRPMNGCVQKLIS